MATIESELGTDIALDQGDVLNQEETLESASAEEPQVVPEVDEAETEETVALSEDVPESEPQEDASLSQEVEEDIPTIEVHGADEKDNDLFASREDSQTSFFG